MGWFDDQKSPKLKNQKKASTNTPSGLWKKCTNCSEVLYTTKLENNLNVCPYCDYHFRLSALDRLDQIIDKGTFQEEGKTLKSNDPLKFVDKKSYEERLDKAELQHNKPDGTLVGLGEINGAKVALGIMDFKFMGGSMGVVTGEKIAYAMDLGFENKVPTIVVCGSGGARMQEGLLSLMQMAKTSASRQRLKNVNLPFISVLTDPTTGGTAASFGMQGDIIIAEPNALIGFAGPRVIEQSIRQSLPDGFQRSEFLKDHGFVDRIVHRKNMKEELSFFVRMFSTNE